MTSWMEAPALHYNEHDADCDETPRRSAPAPLRIEVPGVPDVLAPTRWQLRAWLEQAGVSADDGLAIQTAADEAISNVIVHAYQQRPPGPLRVLANLDAGHVVRIEVADDGHWRPERDPDTYSGGRGLQVIRRMMDDVAITTGDTGTKIVMRRRLRPSGSD